MKIQQFLSSLYDYHTSIIATASATDTTINIKKTNKSFELSIRDTFTYRHRGVQVQNTCFTEMTKETYYHIGYSISFCLIYLAS
jgi:hypothetical protein